MKPTQFIIAFLLMAITGFTQPAAITVFSDSEPLILTIDGKKINVSPQTSVTAWDITAEGIRLHISLLNQTGINLTQNVMVRPGMEMKVLVKQNRKGKWVTRYQGEGPLPVKTETGQYQPETETVKVTESTSTTESVAIDGTTSDQATISVHTNAGGSDENVSVTTTVNEEGGSESVSINANVAGNAVTVAICGGRDFEAPIYQTVANLSKSTKL